MVNKVLMKQTFSAIKLFLVISCFFSLTFSVNLSAHEGTDRLVGIDYETSTNSATYSVIKAYPKQNFRLDFPNSEVPRSINYIKVELQADNDIPTPILHFSSNDDSCESGRQQVVKDPNSKKVVLWLKVEEFEDGDLFVLVELVSTASSEYTLTFTGTKQIEMGPNFSYSYLVGSGNKELVFYADYPEKTPNSVTFYAVGSKSVSLTVDGVKEITKFSLGNAVTVKPKEENSSQYLITVKANEGDYITVGVSNVVEGKTDGDVLQPNGLEVSGLLVRDILNDQCFEMSTLEEKYKSKKIYLNGRFYNRIAEVYLRDSSFNVIDDSVELVTDGFYNSALATNGKKNSLCVRFPEESYNNLKIIPFTLYVTETSSIEPQYKFYPPQIMGQIYRRTLQKNGIQFYSSLSPPKNKRITFNLKAKSGFPKMYFGRCRNYPQCNFPDDEIKFLTAPTKANRMYTYTYPNIEDTTPLSSDKYVIVVKCLDDDNSGSGYCEFETSFTSPDNELEIVENETFGQFAVKGDKGTFRLNLEGDTNVRTINVDIMVLSGDITFSIKGNAELNYHKYFLSNKVYFKISTEDNDEIKSLTFEYSATLNSYYTFKWNANRRGDGTARRDYIVSGYSYLVDIDPTAYLKQKTIKLQNLRYKDSKPFLANFYALNCGFKLSREGKEIAFYDGYAQEIVTPSSDKYSTDYYNYVLNITEPDLSNYNHKMCMIYIAGAESSTSEIESEILIGENIEQQMIFEHDYNLVRFLYPHSDISKDLALKVNVIDTSIYKVTVYAHRTQVKTFEVATTQILHLPPSLFEKACEDNSLCAIIIQVELSKKLVDTNPMISVTIRPFLNTPTYFEKSQAKQDFVCGTKYYYLYTDIGKNEEGEILVDFLRGNGEVYAKVVRKDQTSAEEDANWRDIYRMPSAEWEDSLPYNSYLKKLVVGTEETADCIEGCYLLITINLALSGDYVEDYRFLPFLILTRVTPSNRAYTDIPKVVIQVDEYIVGNVDIVESERIYEFYEIWLPHDSETVEFDWQSEVAGLYVNLGGTRPTIKNADFKLLPHGSDEVLMISKNEILERVKAKNIPLPYKDKIQDLSLVIGIWTDKTNSIDTEPYSLRIHQPMDEGELDIMKVNSNQKILCRPSLIDGNKLRCLFMVVFENSQVVQNLIAYGASIDKSATNRMYAKVIDKNIYDEYNTQQLKNNIPTNDNSEYNSQIDGVNYIFANSIDNDKYLFVSVVTDSPDDVMFLSGFGTFDFLIYPNSSSEQLLVVLPIHTISLQFSADQDIIVSVECVAGQGEFYWGNHEEQVYQLNGPGDRLIISSGSDVADNKRSNLMVTNRRGADKDKTKMADPGFVFYVSYYLRNPARNFDEVFVGKSMEIAYRDTDMPVSLFSKIHGNFNDINIVVTLKNDPNIKDNEPIAFEESPFKFNSAVIKESLAYLAKNEPDVISLDKSMAGAYDPAINTAQGFLSEKDVEKFNVRELDNPTLYAGLFKNGLNNLVYKKFDLEVQVTKSNDGISALDGVYNYGKVVADTQSVYYKLKTDKFNKVMRLQISYNSNNLGCIITDEEQGKNNMTFVEDKKGNGKSIITLNSPVTKEYIYLTIYIKDKKLGGDRRLNNYCFKYVNAESADKFKEYKIKGDRKVKFNEEKETENTTKITAEFDKIDAEGVNITYAFKVVPNRTHVYGESYDTIAVSESPASVVYIRNPKTDSKIRLEMKGVNPNWVYLEVTAIIEDKNSFEYEAYSGKKELRPDDHVYEDGTIKPWVFIVVGGILLLIVVGLVIVVIVFKNRNKSLLNQVKHVSFQKTNSNTDPNLLLSKQNNQSGEQA